MLEHGSAIDRRRWHNSVDRKPSMVPSTGNDLTGVEPGSKFHEPSEVAPTKNGHTGAVSSLSMVPSTGNGLTGVEPGSKYHEPSEVAPTKTVTPALYRA